MNARAVAWITLLLCTSALYFSVAHLIQFRTFENLIIPKVPLENGSYSLLLENECIGSANVKLFDNTSKGISINGKLGETDPNFKIGLIFNPFGQLVGGTVIFQSKESSSEYRLNHISPITIASTKFNRTEIRRFLGPLTMKKDSSNTFSIYYNSIIRGKEKLTKLPIPAELGKVTFKTEEEDSKCEVVNPQKAQKLKNIIRDLA